jgi:porin
MMPAFQSIYGQPYRVLSCMRIVAGLIIALVLTSQPAHAADDAATAAEAAKPATKETFKEQLGDVWSRELLTGDWEGWRTNLQEHGIDPQFRLSQFGQWVADGGVETDGGYAGTMDYRINADLKKLFGLWDGLTVAMHARSRWGQDVNQAAGAFALPNAGPIMPLPGNYTGTDVTGLTVSQSFPAVSGRIPVVTLGKLDVIDTLNGFFPSVGYGQEGFWNVNALVTALPWFGAVEGLSLYGAYGVTINEEYQSAESGLLVTGTQGVSDNWNSLQDSFDDGVWIAAFQRVFWKLEDKPGYIMIFAAGSTRDQPSNDPRDWTIIPGAPPAITSTNEDKPWDIALYLSQVLWQAEDDPSRKATVLLGGTVGPDDPQFAQYNFFASVEAYGPMASRPADRMGVSFWYNWLSDNYKQLVRPVINLRDLYGFEIYYNIAINNWFHVTPDLQFIKNERNGDDLAIIPGIRAVIDF